MKTTADITKRMILPFSVLLFTSGYSGITLGACYFTSGSSEQRWNFTLPNITVQRDAPAGTVLAEQRLPQRPTSLSVGCTSTSSYLNGEFRFNTVSAYGNGVYNTNVMGIGIRISSYSYDSDRPGHLPYSGNISPPATIWLGNSVRVQLVKTVSNDVGTGVIAAGTASRSYIGSPKLYYETISINRITVNRAACTVTTTSIPVSLGNKTSADFAGVGSTTTDVPFTIPLNCIAGTRVNVTLEGSLDPSAAPGVLALSPSSTDAVANGVGVQVLYKSTPVTFGKIINIGAVSGGNYGIAFIGRYYQTADKMTGGLANATATFTMTYN